MKAIDAADSASYMMLHEVTYTVIHNGKTPKSGSDGLNSCQLIEPSHIVATSNCTPYMECESSYPVRVPGEPVPSLLLQACMHKTLKIA